MNIFNSIEKTLNNLFGVNGSHWVIRKSDSVENLETCNGETHNDEKTKTYELCIALNDTIFKNNNNKPDYYHLNCRCKNIITDLNKPILLFNIDKITKYLFVDENKKNIMKSMGYNKNDFQEIYNIISKNVRKEFMNGNYTLKYLNRNGQQIINYWVRMCIWVKFLIVIQVVLHGQMEKLELQHH